jgi:hypothetical protein
MKSLLRGWLAWCRRDGAIVALGAVLLAGVMAAPPGMWGSHDYTRFHEPLHVFTARALREGHLPLWNPHVNLGRPHLADLQAMVLYPTTLLDLVLPQAIAFGVAAALHLALAWTGTSALARALGASRWTAMAAGLAFAAGGPLASALQTGTIEALAAAAYLPWALVVGQAVQERRSLGDVARLALLLALQLLCGHPQYAWMTWLALGVLFLARRLERPFGSNVRLLAGDLARLAVAGLAMALAAAVQLVPFATLAAEGNRGRPSLEFAAAFAMAWRDWATVVRPVSAEFLVNWAGNLYLTIPVALAGGVGLVRLRDREVRGLAAVALVGALLAAGDSTPVFELLYHLVPGVSSFRVHARAVVLVALPVIVVAALALDRVDWRERKARVATGLAALVAIAGVLTIEAGLVPGSHTPLLSGAQVGVVLVTATLLLARGDERWRARATLALAGVALADLAHGTWALKSQYRAEPSGTLERSIAKAVATSLQHPSGAPPRVSIPHPWVRENAGMLFGYSTWTGYVSLSLDRVWSHVHEARGLEASTVLNTIPSNSIYQRHPRPFDTMAIEVGFDTPRRKAVTVAPVDPRVYLVGAARRVRDYREATALMRDGHDPHREALLETALPELPGVALASGEASLELFEPERLVVNVTSETPALLVVAEAWYPFWRARVNGEEAPCLPANAWMRAVPVPAGTSRVELRYEERWLLPSALVSLATITTLVMLARRRGAPSRAPSVEGLGSSEDGASA